MPMLPKHHGDTSEISLPAFLPPSLGTRYHASLWSISGNLQLNWIQRIQTTYFKYIFIWDIMYLESFPEFKETIWAWIKPVKGSAYQLMLLSGLMRGRGRGGHQRSSKDDYPKCQGLGLKGLRRWPGGGAGVSYHTEYKCASGDMEVTGFLTRPSTVTVKTTEWQGRGLRNAAKGTEKVDFKTSSKGPGLVCFWWWCGQEKGGAEVAPPFDKSIFASRLVSCRRRQWKTFSFTSDLS